MPETIFYLLKEDHIHSRLCAVGTRTVADSFARAHPVRASTLEVEGNYKGLGFRYLKPKQQPG